MRDKVLFTLTAIACAWTLIVVVLGAYVRLSHAGLGCPDWPGCYGHMVVPDAADKVDSANLAYPQRPLESAKAWKEMVHRYFAGGLGLLVLAIAVLAWRRHGFFRAAVPLSLLGLIVFQALLGMWTVTLLLKPLIVTAHLLGGMATLGLLAWLVLSYSNWQSAQAVGRINFIWRLAVVGLIALVAQIALGGWTSSNYSALACYGFPQCNLQWWPRMDFKDAFILWRGLGIDYEGGVLNHPARVAIHMTHRIGAIIVFGLLGLLAVLVWLRATAKDFKWLAALVLILLCMQIGLGIGNVTLGLPLPVATAHNAVAALLLLTMLCLLYRLRLARQQVIRVRAS